MPRSRPVLAALGSLLSLAGCEDPAPSRHVSAPDAGSAAPAVPTGVRVRLRAEGAYTAERGLWRARFEAEGQVVTDVSLAVEPNTAPEALVEGLDPGPYLVTIWLDRDGDGALNGCPFPPRLEDATRPDSYENLVGRAEVLLDADRDLSIAVDRRTCGPGDAATGLSGVLDMPEAVEGPLLLRLRASMGCPGVVAAADAALEDTSVLTVAMGPGPVRGARAFELGELLPGCFDLTFFADADGDGLPTPCDGLPPGGDRAVHELPAVEVVKGERRALEEPIPLAPAEACAEVLTGLRGTVVAAKPSAAAQTYVDAGALAEPAAPDGAEPAGQPRVAITSLRDATTVDWPLAFSRVPEDAPLPFVLSGLAPGRYDVAIYLDGDADGRFGPCGGPNGGVDSVFEQRMGIEITAEGLTDLGEVRLQRSADCAEADTQLTLRPEIELEDGPVGSGRPVRLELLPMDSEGDRRSVLLFENHRDLDARPAGADGAWHLGLRVRPGSYQARVYVDTDRNGLFGSCEDDLFQDRATSETLPLTFGAGPTVDLGAIRVARLPCDVPAVAIGPEFRMPEGVETPPGLFLRFQISESGGWKETYPLRTPVTSAELPYVQPPFKLAPGEYTLLGWLDAAPDGPFDDCESPEPEAFSGGASFVLDADTPAARPLVELGPACSR